jgi:hypothetical protein
MTGLASIRLIHYRSVSDWRQIQARIRKARTSADPPGQLAALYERTRDAMVAFELAQIHEKAGANAEAARWYTSAAERFRRAQWKLKAEEALTRLGAPIPVTPAAVPVSQTDTEPEARLEPIISEYSDSPDSEISHDSPDLDGGQQEAVFEQPSGAQPAGAPTPLQVAGAPLLHRRKRRGRRGGRGRHKGPRVGGPVAVGTPGPVPVPAAASSAVHERPAESIAAPIVSPYVSEEISQPRVAEPDPISSFEQAASGSSASARTRAGDPALSSRMTRLESQLRRMLACSVRSVDQAEEAPAGPGVFLITDSDQTTYYYVEACQTLRVGIGNLLRSGRGSREGADLKEKLAEHLGINEARVGKYLKEHCVVRWLQLDEGAPLLSHFAIAVLRPIANS